MIKLPDNAFQKGIEDPVTAFKYIYNKLVYKQPYLFCRSLNQIYYRNFGKPGNLDVMEEDWDTLILIDACRYDYFSEQCDIPGKLEHRFSPGSMSLEFIEYSFCGRELHDTVYVTGNPFAMEIESGTFHNVISLIDDYYDNDIGTVPPEEVITAAQEAHKNHPKKRIIVHLMQPHEPFLSEFGQHVSDRLRWKGNQYHLPRDVSLADLRRAYRENIDIVLEQLEDMIPDIDGKIVISSDHGELLGERLRPIPIKGLEHPTTIYKDDILRVPWLEIDGGERRDIVAEPPKKQDKMASETAQKRLKQLGYL